MLFIIALLLFAIGYTCLFYFLIDLSSWFLFLWIPSSILLAAITIVLLTYLYLLLIGQHTKNEAPFKHILLRNATWLILKYNNIKYSIEGKENIPSETFVVYANHKSNYDPFFIYYGLKKKPITAVGKKSLFSNHVMKVISKTFKAVELDRDNDREAAKTMINAIKQVKDGMSMIIFPEGGIKTRDVEEMVNLRAGAYKLALKPNATILPIAICGSSKTAKVPFYKKKTIKVYILPAIKPSDYEGLNTTEVGNMVEEMINKKVKEYE